MITPAQPSGALAIKKACKTCRVRRIKCDKSFPSCQKCTTTGRKCDGYGIWGGGSPAKTGDGQPAMSVFVARKSSASNLQQLSVLAIPLEDRETLEWFQYRTMRKTPGMFKTDFWNTLLLQASTTEPAIMHGILALASVHRCGVTLEIRSLLSQGSAGRSWTAGLQHYVEAINGLRQRVSNRGVTDRFTLRVVIVTCMVFVYIELLRGEIDSAQAHLRSGVGLLREAGWLNEYDEPTAKALKSPEAVDRWIIEVTHRMHQHDETFNLFFLNRQSTGWTGSSSPVSVVGKTEVPSAFAYMEEAWMHADRLLLAAIYLTQDCKATIAMGERPDSQLYLVSREKQLQIQLRLWYKAFRKSISAPFRTVRGPFDQSPALIQISYNLAHILTETALSVDDETVYDKHGDAFRLLLDHSAEMVRIYKRMSAKKVGKPLLMSFTILDICSLPVFYYTATKCRQPEMRREALAGLGVFRHRECHWDGWLTYEVAKKVVELEEDGAWRRGVSNRVSEAATPASSRLQGLRIVTEGDPYTRLTLEFERMTSTRGKSTHRVPLDVRRGRWSDEPMIHDASMMAQ